MPLEHASAPLHDAADPIWASPLPPFARGHQFLEHLVELTAREWREVTERALTVDEVTRRGAMRQVGAVLVGHPQTRAFAALRSAAQGVVESAVRRRLVPDGLLAHLATLTSFAACAVVLREVLSTAHASVLYAPFVTSLTACARFGTDAVRRGGALDADR
jgi:hypothetical protein